MTVVVERCSGEMYMGQRADWAARDNNCKGQQAPPTVSGIGSVDPLAPKSTTSSSEHEDRRFISECFRNFDIKGTNWNIRRFSIFFRCALFRATPWNWTLLMAHNIPGVDSVLMVADRITS